MRVQIGGINLALEDRGVGIPLLFIHGYPLSRRIWDLQLEGLADAARLIAPDLRGHGDSDAAPGPYSMDLLADDCQALLEALGITVPVVLCGLSMGGYIAFAFNRKFPERVAGLILTATRPGEDSPEGKVNRDKAADLARRSGPSAIAESMLPKMLSPKSYVEKPELVHSVSEIMQGTSLDGIIGDLMGMKMRSDSTPTLRKIEKLTLILHGSDDQLIPPSEAIAMRGAIPEARLNLLPDAGHLLNMEQPQLFNSAVREFIRELQP
jgi:pimeloyl-ACP methyl ester carboxylesterase